MKLRHVLSFLLILFSAATYGQTFTEIRANRVLVSNALRPGMDTIMLNVRDSGTLAHKNGRIYVWNGYRWNQSTYAPIINIGNSDLHITDEERYLSIGPDSSFYVSDADKALVYLAIEDRTASNEFGWFLKSKQLPGAATIGGLAKDSTGVIEIVTQNPKIYPFRGSQYGDLGIQVDTNGVRISGVVYGDVVNYANTSNHNASLVTTTHILEDLTGAASRTLALHSKEPGALIRILNQSSDGTNKWSFAGATVYDKDGTTVTTLDDHTCYELMYLPGAQSGFGAGWHITKKYSLSSGVGASTLNDLTNVTITAPSSGQVLKYNGSAWVNDTDATGGGSSRSMRTPGTELLKALGLSIAAETLGRSRSEMTTAIGMNNQQMWFSAVYLDTATTLTGVGWYQNVQGVYTAGTTNAIGLYTLSGGNFSKVAETSNNGDLWKGTANTEQRAAFTSTYNAAAGVYWVVALYNQSAQTTQPSIGAYPNSPNAVVSSAGMTGGNRLTGTLNSQTSLPATITASTVVNTNQQYYFFVYQP